MIKFFSKVLFLFLITIVLLAIYLTYFGLKTNNFNDLIKSKANEVNRNVKLGFKETKIYLNPLQLDLTIKLENSKILIKDSEIILSKLDLFLPLRSLFTSNFILKRAEIAFVKNDIKDLTKVTNIFLPRIINKQLNKIFLKGNLQGEFIVPFDVDGSIGKNYGFSGKILNASINATKEFPIKNLTAEINHIKDSNKDIFTIKIKKGSIFDLQFSDSEINLSRESSVFKIKSLLRTSGKFDFNEIKKVSSLFDLNINNLKDVNGNANLKTKVTFDLSKNLKIKNLFYSTSGNINYIEIQTEEKSIIKDYLPDYNPKIIIKDAKIEITNSKANQMLELNGFIKVKNHFDSIKIKEIYNYNKKNFDFKGVVDLTNSKVKITQLNYLKEAGKKSEINFDINFVIDKYYNIKSLNFLNGKSKINLSDIKLNQKFQLLDFKNFKTITFKNKIKNNDFSIKKGEKIIIYGEIYDAEPLLKSLYKKSKKKNLSDTFKSEVKINFNNAFTGTQDDIFNFSMIASIKNGSYEKFTLKGNFSENEIIEISLYQIDKNTKILQVISDRARPFVKNFDFIKGFEDGKLEYESTITKESSVSILKIFDFKVSQVPALAKLLTLASLQGIADTLSGEGISFDTFEMESITKGNWIDINETYASGPAISILLDGYVDKGKLVSLRGTLVPARTINSIISSIPIVGEILVGKKTGEGVFGVSFKMKGPPKNIKTTVNPIKTLTPRFIVRAVEKMKKKKKDKTK